ncbi:MAG: YqiA/YcfP family alpha/beta fold hydrolase [Oxalobacteraceae bacterium]
MILYLHGFRSSPQSSKARLLDDFFAARGESHRFQCPQLPVSPAAAMRLARELCRAQAVADLALIGSSLGGFYATALAEEFGCRAVLLNPAITPADDLRKHMGVQRAWHSDAQFEFRAEFVDELVPMACAHITRPERYFLIAATGDEVLDWRQMVAHYPGARQTIIQGSDHGLSDFAQHVEAVIDFCRS